MTKLLMSCVGWPWISFQSLPHPGLIPANGSAEVLSTGVTLEIRVGGHVEVVEDVTSLQAEGEHCEPPGHQDRLLVLVHLELVRLDN